MKINGKNNKIRIIGGFLKNQFISTKNLCNVRPTTNFMKETLFNWLKYDIINANCLDCFAGSGSLGIEAISRYAKKVTFIDSKKKLFII